MSFDSVERFEVRMNCSAVDFSNGMLATHGCKDGKALPSICSTAAVQLGPRRKLFPRVFRFMYLNYSVQEISKRKSFGSEYKVTANAGPVFFFTEDLTRLATKVSIHIPLNDLVAYAHANCANY